MPAPGDPTPKSSGGGTLSETIARLFRIRPYLRIRALKVTLTKSPTFFCPRSPGGLIRRCRTLGKWQEINRFAPDHLASPGGWGGGVGWGVWGGSLMPMKAHPGEFGLPTGAREGWGRGRGERVDQYSGQCCEGSLIRRPESDCILFFLKICLKSIN